MTDPTHSQQHVLRALAQLPEARRVPTLRSGRTMSVRPVMSRRHPLARPSMSGRVRPPAPIMDRLLAGEFQRRLVLVLAGVTLFVVAIVALGASFFA